MWHQRRLTRNGSEKVSIAECGYWFRPRVRLVTTLSLFGALSNLIYSAYVISIALLKADVAPGWVTLSLQQSGMFFLISLVLLVLGEYILQMASLSNEGPPITSGKSSPARICHRTKLNVEETTSPMRNDAVAWPERTT